MDFLKTALLTTLLTLMFQPQTAEAICLPTTIKTTTNQTVVNTCPGDGIEDKVKFKPSSFATAYRWLVTDTNDVIIDWFLGNNYDFEPLGEGVNRVWGISYTGSIDIPIGENVFDADYDVVCHIISDNFVLVNRIIPDAGEVTLDNGSTTAYVCPGDGQANILNFVNIDAKPGDYAYIITDVDGNIVGSSVDPDIDFEPFPVGTCMIYGTNYAGNLTADIGNNIFEDDIADSCFDISETAVTVIKAVPESSAVSLDNNSDAAEFCSNDGESNILNFTNVSNSNALYGYLITDENNVLLGIVTGDSHDFEGVAQGVCRVYGLSFTGDLSAQASIDIFAQALSTDCWEVSANYVTVTRHASDAGTITLLGGGTSFNVCPGNEIPDIAEYENNSVSTANYAYFITDTLGNILAITMDTAFDFDEAGEGICRIYGVSYWEELTADIGENITDNVLASECYAVTENFITVIREFPNAGEVALEDGDFVTYTCPGDGNPDEINFTNNSPTNSNYAYFITDENDVLIGQSTTGTADFEEAGVGVCRVYGVAFTGNLIFTEGDTIQLSALSDDCYHLSENYVEVIRDNPVGGMALFSDSTEIKITCSDGNPDILNFVNEGISNSKYAYVIADIDNVVVGITGDSFDFDGGDLGFYFIFGVAYTGNITLQVGDDISLVDFSDDCFDYATNLPLVIKTVPDGGEINLIGGATETTVCSGDDVADILELDSNTGSEADYVFAITDENDVVLDVNPNGIIDFEGVADGVCRIYGISYTGNLEVMAGSLVLEDMLSDDCYSVSSNYVTVTRTFVEGADVLTNGESVIYTCPFDQVSNIVQFETNSTANNASYSYVFTNTSNIITEIPSDDEFDFEELGIGITRVYGISHIGNLTFEVGDDITITVLSDDCYDLSDSYLEVIRDIPIGDQIVSDAGSSVDLCVNDGISDIVTFQTGSFSFAQYAWVLTDENDIIEAIYTDNVIDFDESNPGNCRVYGMSYTGNIIAFPGTPIIGLLTDDCYDISSNFIELNRTGVDGSTIFFPNNSSDTAYVCPNNGAPDFLGFFNNSNLPGTDYRYVITDTNDVVLAIVPFNLFDFDNFGEGICRVWGISHTGDLEIDDEDILTEVSLSDGCYELSDNFLTIIKVNPEGGEIFTEDGETEITIEIDDQPDSIYFANTASDLAKFRYIVTDDNDMILAILEDNVVDFNGAGVGNCRVYGLSFTGSLQAQVGDILLEDNPATGCWAMTENFVTVIRIEGSDDLIGNFNNDFSNTSNQFFELKTYPNPVSDYLTVNLKTVETESGQLIITNTNGQIIYVQDFEGLNENLNFEINVNDWNTGYYFVQWKGESNVARSKILVSH